MFNNKVVKITAGLLVSALLISVLPAQVVASSANDATNYITATTYTSFSAGAHAAINETVVLENEENDTLYAGISSNGAPVVATAVWNNPYADIGIAKVNEYVNIRASADSNAESVGKLYKNGAVKVLETLDGWYKISSGNVVGYIAADYLTVGDPATCEKAATVTGKVTANSLKLRKAASADAGVYTSLSNGTKVKVVDQSIEGWVKVKYGSYTGYVSADYLTITTTYSYAESKAEEAARLAAEEAARKAAEEAARKKAEEEKKKQEEAEKNYVKPTGGTGQDVANYAVQFVGNPYKWGGTSLTNGADCSGFVQSVYKAFGVTLPRTSYQQRFCGYAVSASDIQPGDIVCYDGHVAIYIGNGKIVHAANRNDGIKISNNWKYQKVLAIRRVF